MISNISTTDMKFINSAAMEAQKSPVLMRHGAVAVANGKILVVVIIIIVQHHVTILL